MIVTSLEGFNSLFHEQVRSRITNEMVRQRYAEMVENKDKRVYDVSFFLSSSIPLLSNDELSINRGVEFAKSIANGNGIKNAKSIGKGSSNYVRTPDGFVLPGGTSWSRLTHSKEVQKDPANIKIGARIIEKYDPGMLSDDRQFYKLTYILDKKHYPVLGLEESIGRIYPKPSAAIRKELYEEAVSAVHEKLWSHAKVMLNDRRVTKARNYTSCPSK